MQTLDLLQEWASDEVTSGGKGKTGHGEAGVYPGYELAPAFSRLFSTRGAGSGQRAMSRPAFSRRRLAYPSDWTCLR